MNAMTCEWVRDNATLYVYDELADDARYEMERHLERCAGCREEVESARAFRTRESDRRVPDDTPGEVGSKRSALTEAGPDAVRMGSPGVDCPEDEERPCAARRMPGRVDGLALAKGSFETRVGAPRTLSREAARCSPVGGGVDVIASPSMRW